MLIVNQYLLYLVPSGVHLNKNKINYLTVKSYFSWWFLFSFLADGFNRSESSVAIILQNSLDAKRSYGTVLGVKMEQYGELRGVFTNYSTERYKQIVMEAYKEAGVDPANVAYVEADGCAVKVRSTSRLWRA